MIVSVQFTSYGSAWTGLTEEQFGEIRAVIPGLPLKKDDARYQKYMVDDAGLRVLARLGIEVTLSEDTNVDTMLTKLADRVRDVEMRVEDQHQFSDRVQIAIPDMALMYVNEVTYMDDACTDALQTRLDEGWRILAVCPPNAQRRPDYILGRRKP